MFQAPFSRLFVSASIAFLFSVATARADLEISVASGTISPGGNLTLDIGINSDGPPQDLGLFSLILEITPLTATGGTSLQFVDPQSESFLGDADYVFAIHSEAIQFDEPTFSGLPGGQIEFYDVNVNDINTSVTSLKLLASVDVSHLLGGTNPALTAGDQFEISVAEDSLFTAAGDFAPEIDFTSTSGRVSVGAVAIPEPTSVALLVLSSCGLMVQRRRRR